MHAHLCMPRSGASQRPPPLAPSLPLLLTWTAADSDSSAPRLRPHQLGTPLKYPAHPLPHPYSFLCGVSPTKHQLPEAQTSIQVHGVCVHGYSGEHSCLPGAGPRSPPHPISPTEPNPICLQLGRLGSYHSSPPWDAAPHL